MRRIAAAVAILSSYSLAGCVSQATMAQYRAAEQITPVEVVVPDSKETVFDRAMAALVQEGWTVQTAERDAGLLVTAPRYGEGSAFASMMIGGSGKQAMVLTVNAVAAGSDSTRAVVSGTWQWDGATNAFAKAPQPINGSSPGFALLRRIGEKIKESP